MHHQNELAFLRKTAFVKPKMVCLLVGALSPVNICGFICRPRVGLWVGVRVLVGDTSARPPMILYILVALVTVCRSGFQCVQLQFGYKRRGAAYGTLVLQDMAHQASLHLLQGVTQVLLVRITHTSQLAEPCPFSSLSEL